MKARLLVMLLVSFLTASASDFTLRLKDHSPFIIQFNGSFFNNPQSAFNATNVPAGYHFIRVHRLNPAGHSFLVYSGTVFVPEYSKVTAILDKHRRIKVFTEPLVYNYGDEHCEPVVSYAPQPIHPDEFYEIRTAIEKSPFSSTRLSIAKKELSERYLSSAQVAELLTLFVFESDKLDLAKFCYDRTIDKRNYYKVNDSFNFSSSIEELNEFITGK